MKLYRDDAGRLVDEDYARRNPDTTSVDDHPMTAIARAIYRIDKDTLSLRADITVIKAAHDRDMRLLRARIKLLEEANQ